MSVQERGAAAVAAVGLNVAAIVALADVPAAYRLARLDEWVRQTQAHPVASAASGVFFTVGLVALAVWALRLREERRAASARAGLLLIALGAMLNAAGTLAPVVVGHHLGADPASLAVARGLLGTSLALDATFNLLLGLGLCGVAAAAEAPGWLRGLALAAGLASLPVAAQAVYDPAAGLLLVAGPLWLAFVLVSGLRPAGVRAETEAARGRAGADAAASAVFGRRGVS